MDDIKLKLELLQGLQSDPKFFPDGFAYDKDGLALLEDYKTSCPSNYFHEAELDLLSNTSVSRLNTLTILTGQMYYVCM